MDLIPFLQHSIFFNSKGFDPLSIQISKYLNTQTEIENHVIVDEDPTFSPDFMPSFYTSIRKIDGYRVNDIVLIDPQKILKSDFVFRFPKNIHRLFYELIASHFWKKNRIRRVVLVQMSKLSENRNLGPQKLNILFIKGEPLFTYQSLYIGNRILPTAVVIPDRGWGISWKDNHIAEDGNVVNWLLHLTLKGNHSFVISRLNLSWNDIENMPFVSNENLTEFNLYKFVG